MSTGVTSNKKKNKKMPFFLDYEGKLTKEEILSQSYNNYLVFSQDTTNSNNKLYFGNNLDVLLNLYNSGYKEKIKLIYIDPPFATEFLFLNKEQQEAYHDNLSGGEYIEFLRERLLILKELLTNDGSIYLHLDNTMAFPMKIIMDEIFGTNNCRAFITRKKCSTKNSTRNTFGNISDYVMFYSKSSKYTWNRPYKAWSNENFEEEYPCFDEKTGKRYKKVPIHAPGIRNGDSGKEWHGLLPPPGKHWQYKRETLDQLDANGEIYWSPSGNPRRKVFFDPEKGIPIQDIWLDYRDSINQSIKTTGYPTEKNIDMLNMIIQASSNEGDIVLDCFAGSGTTLDAAQQNNRIWIGVDNSPESLKAIIKRLTIGLDTYGDYVNKKIEKQHTLDLYERKFTLYCREEDMDLVSKLV